MIDYGLFGKNMLRIMRKKHIRQDDLAKHVGITQSVISKYANGTVYPRADTAYEIAQFLGADMGELFAKE